MTLDSGDGVAFLFSGVLGDLGEGERKGKLGGVGGSLKDLSRFVR